MKKTFALALMFVATAAQAQTTQTTQSGQTTQPTPQTAQAPQLSFRRLPLKGCSADQIDLGFDSIVCQSCTVSGKHTPGQPDIEFSTEPTIAGIRKGGPADGKLEEHDVLVAIDGQLITTRAAALRYSSLVAGAPVRLTVRRNGVQKDVEITPASSCSAPRLFFSRFPDTQFGNSRVQLKQSVITTPLKRRGFFGVGLSCPTCGTSLGVQVTTPFRAYPEIAEVTPDSPAAKAGIKAGDVILAIDNVAITSSEGSALFRDVKPNQTVKILLIRNAEVITVTLTAGAPR